MLPCLIALAAIQSATRPVVFSYESATAKSVKLSGDFDTWSKPLAMIKEGEVWSISLPFPDTARIEYKVIVDGQWILDPANPNKISNGLGGENSVWEGSKYKFHCPDSTPATPLRRSEIQVGGRTIIVYSPRVSAGLPIIAYGDGRTYENPGKIQNVVANLVALKEIRPVVIVLVPPIDRMKEYGPDWKAYGHYLLDDVLPAVRKETGASGAAKDVFIGGSSLGGLISLRLAEEFPTQVAGGIHCQSAAFQWSPLKLDFSEAITSDKLSKLAKSTRVWLDWGTFESDLTKANLLAVRNLQSIRRPFGSYTTDEGHNWTAWRNRMAEGLIYLLSPEK